MTTFSIRAGNEGCRVYYNQANDGGLFYDFEGALLWWLVGLDDGATGGRLCKYKAPISIDFQVITAFGIDRTRRDVGLSSSVGIICYRIVTGRLVFLYRATDT